MKVLITGGTGFVGSHLAVELLTHNHDVHVTSLESNARNRDSEMPMTICDIQDRDAIVKLVQSYQPDAICHLAGLAHVVNSGKNPDHLINVNLNGIQNVAFAASNLNKKMAILFASSAFVYGENFKEACSINELTPTLPSTVYGHVKLAAEHVLRSYENDKLSCYIARPFNHIGPGQHESFVCPALAKRIKLAKNGDSIEVGNINAKRDFSDVRDIARAYRLILEIQPKERIFVLGSSKTHSISEVIQIFTKISGKSISTRVSQDLLRPNDNATIYADSSLAQKILGWHCKHEFESTLNDIFLSF